MNWHDRIALYSVWLMAAALCFHGAFWPTPPVSMPVFTMPSAVSDDEPCVIGKTSVTGCYFGTPRPYCTKPGETECWMGKEPRQ